MRTLSSGDIDISIKILKYQFAGHEVMHSLQKSRAFISAQVRELRTARGWTQAELAARLELSQARLSQIERGGGSFSAEQLLVLLRIFNVPVSRFSEDKRDHDQASALQNALARLGARHLHENEDVLPSERIEEVNRVLLQTLLGDSPRLIVAAAPVLVSNIDAINLERLQNTLWELGSERRLLWFVENTLAALRQELPEAPRAWSSRYRRAELVLTEFMSAVRREASDVTATDFLDTGVRTPKSHAAVVAASSEISRRWRIVTRIQPADFVLALRAARE